MDLQVPLELISLLANKSGIQKTLRCKKCSDFTEHVSISYADLMDLQYYKDRYPSFFLSFAKIGGRINDINPFSGLVWGSVYMCIKCGRVRTEGGLLSDFSDFSKVS